MNIITEIDHNNEDQTITVSIKGSELEYVISYYRDEDGFKCSSHNDGYCAGYSDLVTDYPDNDYYGLDSEINAILNKG